jgi:hypothetical protein
MLANLLEEDKQDLHRCIMVGLCLRKHVVASYPADQTQQALLHHVFFPLQIYLLVNKEIDLTTH